ncbi:MAG: dihydropteroate synthase [Pirellulaceae bacterium]|nr:dihydropteroate synthase [Pirellulaceae bacterium]
MPIANLTIIGETINDSVPSTHKLFESGDIAGILEIAKMQDERGAAYIDVNVGPRPPEFMAEMVRKIQAVTARPLSIDTPDPELARAGLEAYDPACAGGEKPIVNSISALRAEMFDLYRIRPFRPILLVSENVVDGRSASCHTAQETYDAARQLVGMFLERCPGATLDDCIIDPGIAPLGSDSEGNIHRLVAAMEMIHADEYFAGHHASVGLSNFTVMLPSKRPDGSPVKGPLESAFLTKVMPLGLDMVIGSVKRSYDLLPSDHPAMMCLEECLKLSGFDVLMRVREFYTS